MVYVVYVLGSIALLMLYFKIATYLNIVDKPNLRSSHKSLTILGAGMIFPFLLFVHILISGNTYPYFTGGLLLISLLSFYDDLRPLPSTIRLVFHLVAVILLFLEAELNVESVMLIFVIYIITIGTINAYNFMDGINGMTALYSLVTVSSLYFINQYVVNFVDSDWLIVCIISLVSFGIFNFRRVAKCFAGDVGSVSMAFIVIFFVVTLILRTQDLKYIGLLLLYGLDTVTTIIFRIIRRENLLKAHRSHFYQYLANERKWSHVKVASLYGLLQVVVNMIVISNSFVWSSFIMCMLLSGVTVILLRYIIEGKQLLSPAP